MYTFLLSKFYKKTIISHGPRVRASRTPRGPRTARPPLRKPCSRETPQNFFTPATFQPGKSNSTIHPFLVVQVSGFLEQAIICCNSSIFTKWNRRNKICCGSHSFRRLEYQVMLLSAAWLLTLNCQTQVLNQVHAQADG